MPKDNIHFGNVEHRDLHNQNGQLFHLGTAMVSTPVCTLVESDMPGGPFLPQTL